MCVHLSPTLHAQPEVRVAQPRAQFVDLEKYACNRPKEGARDEFKQVELGPAFDPKVYVAFREIITSRVWSQRGILFC
jgi:hypothetical protein